jgi:integrase
MSRVFQRNGDWWIDFIDAQGNRRRKKIGPSKRVAQEILNDVLGKVARHVHLGVIEDSTISFADFAQVWEDRVLNTIQPSTAVRWKGIVDRYLKVAFRGSLRTVTMADIETYVARRIDSGATPATVNRELSVLRHILKRAVRWNHITRNPIDGWKPLKEAPGRTRFLSEDEIAKLLAACDESRCAYLRTFVLIALNTGLRRGEVLSLNRQSIDWQNRAATIAKTKNCTEGHIPLNGVAFESLRSLPIRLDGRLFPIRDGHTISRAFRRAVERAGIEDFRLHDLRHTFASHQALEGVQQRGLQALLRHRDTRMTMRYSHLTDEYLRTAVDRVQLGADKRTVGQAKTSSDGLKRE